MPRLLDRMPFPDQPEEIEFRGEPIRIRANQIIIWIALTPTHIVEPDPRVQAFPAILDTGHTHTLSLQHRHLEAWAGLHLERLAELGSVHERGQRIPLYSANVWARPNIKGQRKRSADSPLLKISAALGIAIYPTGDFPRLPILGLLAIADSKLILKVDGARRLATLRTPFRFWPF